MAGKSQPIRWTIEKATVEFGLHRKTLTTKLREMEIEPAADGKFSTKQICEAIFDDASAERVRLLQEQSRRLKLANDKKAGEQADIETIYKMHEGIFIVCRQTVLGSNLSEEEKSQLISQLRYDVLNAPPIE